MNNPMDMTTEMIRSTIVVIPAYQPTQRLVGLADEITGRGYRLIVVDDGSGEGTSDIWTALEAMQRVRVLHHEYNQGKGAAIKTALSFIDQNDLGVETIVTMDADGQHLVSDMQRVAQASWKTPEHLILGSRTLEKEIPWRSWMGNTITRTVYRLVSGVQVYDTQTGLRAFGAALLPRMLRIPGDRYEYEMNVLLQLGRDGVKMEEVPIQTVYLDESNSCSHFDTVKDSARIYRSIFRFAGASFRGETEKGNTVTSASKQNMAAIGALGYERETGDTTRSTRLTADGIRRNRADAKPYLERDVPDAIRLAYLIQAGKRA